MEYDRDNAISALARRLNSECSEAVKGAKPQDYTRLTQPIFRRYKAQADSYGLSMAALKYRMAVMNGVIQAPH